MEMARHFIVHIVLLTILSLIAGCPPTVREPACPPEVGESGETEAPQVELPTPEAPVEPAAGPVQAEPLQAELPTPEPNAIQPVDIEPAEDVPAAVEPNTAELIQAEPNQIEPNEVKPVLPEPNEPEPNEVDSSRRGEPEPNDIQQPLIACFYEKCADILNEFVDEDGIVDYSTLRRKRLELKQLLDEFDELRPNEYDSWSRADKIAFWINAYNIQMLNIIAQNYPIEGSRWLNFIYGPHSIRHIDGIWTKYKFLVMDEEFTLSAVEQRFFRKQFDEPRAFLAISYASRSGPPLRNQPYRGDKLEEQLNDQTKRFLSSSQGFKIDRNEQAVYLSAIFQATWHGKKFMAKFGTDKKFKDQAPATRAVLNFITNYASEQDASFLEVGNYSVKHMKYDWTLNDSSIRQ
jgi:hypothetical protein